MRKVRWLKVSRLFGKMMLNRISFSPPFFLSHLVTARCNCQCPTCLWRNNYSPEMSAEEINKLYYEAGRHGFAANVIWGGRTLIERRSAKNM